MDNWYATEMLIRERQQTIELKARETWKWSVAPDNQTMSQELQRKFNATTASCCAAGCC
ncbi:hypothetical protein [Paenibacillus sp. PAMC21692]|uniref:hypothetical protein n=1 Tax=Paenibacillus sp. PAMC21692 TaxID=2762320 RepID=UPI00164E1A14|nr:hypothetical protein [Paenibacillus sp. PAMC21692]QNK54971.1 hypothetical protein H7F31_20285 [Paenibacillus sp. PAMC21692]